MKQVKGLNKNTVEDLFEAIRKGDKGQFGNYSYKGLKILIRNKDPLTASEKYKRFYHAKRSKGICIQCDVKTKKNPDTGKPYRYCEYHREDELRRKKIRGIEKSIKEGK